MSVNPRVAPNIKLKPGHLAVKPNKDVIWCTSGPAPTHMGLIVRGRRLCPGAWPSKRYACLRPEWVAAQQLRSSDEFSRIGSDSLPTGSQ